jgi:hypothetical protein
MDYIDIAFESKESELRLEAVVAEFHLNLIEHCEKHKNEKNPTIQNAIDFYKIVNKFNYDIAFIKSTFQKLEFVLKQKQLESDYRIKEIEKTITSTNEELKALV